MDLSRFSVPAINQQHTNITFDVLRILYVSEGGKEVPGQEPLTVTSPLHPEVALVVVCLVPDRVGTEKHCCEGNIIHCSGNGRQHHARLRILSDVEGVVAVEQRHACEVPP